MLNCQIVFNFIYLLIFLIRKKDESTAVNTKSPTSDVYKEARGGTTLGKVKTDPPPREG